MINKIKTPAFQSASSTPSSTGAGTDKTLMIGFLLLGGFLLYKFVIKPEMEKTRIKSENDNAGIE